MGKILDFIGEGSTEDICKGCTNFIKDGDIVSRRVCKFVNYKHKVTVHLTSENRYFCTVDCNMFNKQPKI